MAKEDFKKFVRSHPELINYVNSGRMSWQKFYEMYDIYGENNSVWLKYQEVGDTKGVSDTINKATSTVGDTSLKELFNMVKKIDLDSVKKGAEGLQKAIVLLQDLGGNKQANNYQARPLYKHLED
jgi:hypothetical protein